MISFSNEMRLFGEVIGNINLELVFDQFSMDRRWANTSMKNYVWPGIGFGGYCLPKDTLAIAKVMKELNFQSYMINGILQTNNRLIDFFSRKILHISKRNKRIIFLGSSFKVGSDDIRNSKTVELIKNLRKLKVPNLYLLKDGSSRQVIKKLNYLTELTISEILKEDLLIIMLRNQKFLPIINKHPKGNILDIPLLK